jgi:hypothetical protein
MLCRGQEDRLTIKHFCPGAEQPSLSRPVRRSPQGKGPS